MNLPSMVRQSKVFSPLALLTAMLLVSFTSRAYATELVMFEQAGCSWCEAFDNDVGKTYAQTEDGLRAPLRRVDIDGPLPPDLAFIRIERLTPLFVLVDKGREVGRIRGYGGREMFWMQLDTLMQKLDVLGADGERARTGEKPPRTTG